jgi:sigma-54 dependent transcriptional regulator, acetoin dehydrogenase operon transcriptional activator AcoR
MTTHDVDAVRVDDRRLGPTELRALRERFATDPLGTDLSSLRPVIARSWTRSQRWAISPTLRSFEQYRQPRVDEQLRQIAEPVLDELDRLAADTGVVVYLADQDGTITAMRGDPAERRRTQRLIEPGVAMAEDVVGTNSDGTALEEGRAVQVWGAEHFCEGMQENCCTSVPVFDPLRRSVRAVLSLSLPERFARATDARSMALIAQGAAAELTQLLASRLAAREQALLASYLTEVRKRGAENVVVMDDRTTIASKGAMDMLRESEYAILAGYARESERLARPLEREVTLGPATVLQVNARPITSAGETLGSIIRLRPVKTAKSLAVGAVSARRTDRFATLIGESLALRRAVEVAATAVRRRMPAYVIGEPGTGKSTLATAMAGGLADDVVTVDCARDTAAQDVDSLRSLVDSGSALVLRHVDAMPDEARAALTEMLSRFDCPPVIVTMSALRDELLPLTTALGGVEIEMPPLRNRRDDIPSLVRHFLSIGDHGVNRVSSQLLRGLTEADWAANVGQLKAFIDNAAARCNFPELGVQHLSDAQQRALARSPLSRLEEAELQQIREALAEARGNRVKAAELLQIGRSTLYRKIETYSRRGYVLEG